jgi:hypothetical protein
MCVGLLSCVAAVLQGHWNRLGGSVLDSETVHLTLLEAAVRSVAPARWGRTLAWLLPFLAMASSLVCPCCHSQEEAILLHAAGPRPSGCTFSSLL